MNPRPFLRRAAARAPSVLAATGALLVMFGLLAANLHHHGDDGAHHACAICVAAHAPSETTPHVAPSAPTTPRAERVIETSAFRPCAAPRTATAPRGPPAA